MMKLTQLGIVGALVGVLLLSMPGCGDPPEPAIEEPTGSMTTAAALTDAVAANPLPDFSEWWPIGDEFATLMSDAIVSEWTALAGNAGGFETVSDHATEYLDIVYQRDAPTSLVQDFAAKAFSTPLESGEFDALSYAFYRSAFDLIEANLDAYEEPLEAERRNFTRRVGQRAFATLEDRLGLELPAGLDDQVSFEILRAAIDSITTFLKQDGYFRDHGAFVFDVDVEHQGQRLGQPDAEFVDRLQTAGVAHALFEMGYPVILPSAVYLFATVGEAQHHSSRTVEELFARVGYVASETHDFDPSGYPPDMVVELWEVRRR
ncbi:MAG: hypothetical protein QGG24_01140 [Vicinamibacterales bacterium]|jgi:hypothetical protein|nr:hypothetical protein [Vicinamibacterales bacterium]MDP7671552.1 hypothetical protein [Vicinamibacterales bacterium]|tara:strand:- start:1986 stop:2942 length:957 start_codon:yes stop_codon:yes gene_type:complete